MRLRFEADRIVIELTRDRLGEPIEPEDRPFLQEWDGRDGMDALAGLIGDLIGRLTPAREDEIAARLVLELIELPACRWDAYAKVEALETAGKTYHRDRRAAVDALWKGACEVINFWLKQDGLPARYTAAAEG